MTRTLTEPRPDRTIEANACPNCGGLLTVNQDGWKICHACGWSSPPGIAPAPADSGIVASQPEQGDDHARSRHLLFHAARTGV